MLVHVVNCNGKPLMPCSPGKANRLLDQGKAKVVHRTPFTIQLLFGSSGYKQPIAMGVDLGSQTIGVAAVRKNQVLYASEVTLRNDIHPVLIQRTCYRRTRRGRKVRYRKAKWQNRKRSPGWLTPTVRSKIRAHEREIQFVQSILPITDTKIETASFDIHKITNPDVAAENSYQEGRQKDFYNVKQFVLFRDLHTCQKCKGKKKDPKLHVHHIVFRSQGGSDSPDNLITLCKTCHDDLHKQENAAKESLKLQKKRTVCTRDAVQASTIASYLKKTMPFEETFGYETKYKREKLQLPKAHFIDAICICLTTDEIPKLPPLFYKKVCIPCGDYKQTSGSHSEKKIPTGKICGFRKFDKVEWLGKELFIKGRMSTGYAILMDIDGKTVPLKPLAKLKIAKRITARKSCLITAMVTENFQLNTTSSLSVNIESLFSSSRELLNV